MLSREVTTLECVHHPNILRLFEVVETLGRVHLVTEWIRGGELYNRITQGGPLKEQQAVPLYRQLLRAVKHMHTLGFVHRDIKAENVLLVTEERIKLADFGFSTQLLNGPAQRLDTFCGSPPYAAPELFSDDHYIGGPVDIWALGVLLYFMVVGNMPFRAPTVPALRSAVLKGEFNIPQYLSVPCQRLIQRILVHTPSRRPSIDQMLQSQWINLDATHLYHLNLPNELLHQDVPNSNGKTRWFSSSKKKKRKPQCDSNHHLQPPSRYQHTHYHHHYRHGHPGEITILAPIQCHTKRGGSVLAEEFLFPIDMRELEAAIAAEAAPPVTQHRRSIFSGTLKKKIGPMESEKGSKMFNNKRNSIEASKSVESDLQKKSALTLNGGASCVEQSTSEDELLVEEQSSFVMVPTFSCKDFSELSPFEVEARELLVKLGIDDAMLEEAITSGPRSDIIGAYRIIVHRLQKQAIVNRQAELIAKEELITMSAMPHRPKSHRTCVIL